MEKIILTGATGYVGGRLLIRLEKEGHHVRCLVRNPGHLRQETLASTEIIKGDVLDKNSLDKAFEGVECAFYLVHSMQAGENFVERDRKAAKYFADAANKKGVKRIVYLGGLGEDRDNLSPHLQSRHEVGNILRGYGGQVIELRASVVVGSGSLSFEMIRSLTERLPVMVTPRWVRVLAQPISILDLLEYLVQSIEIKVDGSPIFEIGGTTQVSYGDLIREYARQRGLKRLMIPVPVLTPFLSGLWLNLITPLYARVGRALINSIEHPTIVTDHRAKDIFNIQCRDHKTAIKEALRNEDQEYAQTRWSDALASSTRDKSKVGQSFGNRLIDSKKIVSPLSPSDAFRPIRQIGGKRGWYFANTLLKIRGLFDLIIGGVGLRRGRRDPEHLHIGETLDFWRVESYEPDKLLRLKAEMILPGRAWLQFEVEKQDGGSLIRQTAIFDPSGLSGLLYWYLLFPFHQYIFKGMLKNIAKRAKEGERKKEWERERGQVFGIR
ncbi:NAD(P)-dependent oxidoreductase [bacterium F11]|nr:NAD(P)-dependent oxidoreductase [bacterium F11]